MSVQVSAVVLNRLSEKLSSKGFKKTALYEWMYFYPDNKRYIKIEFEGTGLFKVNFNDEECMNQSPFDLWRGLKQFNPKVGD